MKKSKFKIIQVDPDTDIIEKLAEKKFMYDGFNEDLKTFPYALSDKQEVLYLSETGRLSLVQRDRGKLDFYSLDVYPSFNFFSLDEHLNLTIKSFAVSKIPKISTFFPFDYLIVLENGLYAFLYDNKPIIVYEEKDLTVEGIKLDIYNDGIRIESIISIHVDDIDLKTANTDINTLVVDWLSSLEEEDLIKTI